MTRPLDDEPAKPRLPEPSGSLAGSAGGGDLKKQAVRGGVVTLTSQVAGFILGFVSTAILARLIPVGDFGLVAMVASVTGIVTMFRDAGLSQATIQQASITHGQISTLFWVNVALSMTVAAVIAALSPAIALFFGEPRLTGIALVTAASVLASGLGIQHRALLVRDMRFLAIAAIGITSQIVGVIAGIVLAAMQLGYWALVLMALTATVVHTFLCWAMSGWCPGRPVRHSGVRKMLAFGGYLSGYQFVHYFTRQADNILIGRFLGEGPLGHYSKAYGILMLPLRQVVGPLSSVALPGLSRLQNEPRRFRSFFLHTIWLAAVAGFPIAGFMVLEAEPFVLLVLGDDWGYAAEIFAVLAWATPAQVIGGNLNWLYVASGQTKRLFNWSIFGTMGMTTAFALGLPYGAIGVAWGLVVATWLYYPLQAWHATRTHPLTLGDLVSTIRYPALAGLVAAVAGWGASLAVEPLLPGGQLGRIGHLFTTGIALSAVYAALILGTKQSRDRLRTVLSGLKR